MSDKNANKPQTKSGSHFFLARLLSLLPAVPQIIDSIEMIHGNAKNGAEKKDLAMQALGLANAVAQVAIPEEKPAIDAAVSLASNLIDNLVALKNATNTMPAPVLPATGE